MEYKVIGLMSGTSLDGVDLAHCNFRNNAGSWSFDATATRCIPYTDEWKEKLSEAATLSGLQLSLFQIELGHYFGTLIRDFIRDEDLSPDLISSHGHTIFHQPEKKLTLQIGAASEIAAVTGLPVVSDLRSMDVALGGQGAPLVPIGDRYLFSEYTSCLNMGGIANISYERQEERIAYDICPVNMVLNAYANREGQAYDESGKLARSGTVHAALLDELNALEFYQRAAPKSLGKEWADSFVFPAIEKFQISNTDILATFCEHIALQIAHSAPPGKMLITGGGAFNGFLVSRIRHHAKAELILPEAKIIEFKEAIIFGFLGVLRWREEVNCLRSVTGASQDNCGGMITFAPSSK